VEPASKDKHFLGKPRKSQGENVGRLGGKNLTQAHKGLGGPEKTVVMETGEPDGKKMTYNDELNRVSGMGRNKTGEKPCGLATGPGGLILQLLGHMGSLGLSGGV